MGRRTALVGLAALIVLAGWSLIGSLRRREAVTPPLLSERPSAQLSTLHRRESSDGHLESAIRTETQSTDDSLPSTQSRRPEGTWIHGSVRIPEGTPTDDRIEVIARYWDLEGSPPPSVPVKDDGNFLVHFPSGVSWGALELRSRFLYLESEFDLDLNAPARDVLLEPKLGGCIAGRVVPPPGISTRDPDLAAARVELDMTEPDGSPSSEVRSSALDKNLRFEIPQVPAGRDRTLGIASKSFLPSERRLDVPQGIAVELELPLRMGVRVSGRVLDSEGRALAGARIHNDADLATLGLVVGSLPVWDSESDQDGRFQLKAIHSGRVAILAEATGYLSDKVELGDLQEGDTRDGLEIRLASGRIHGRVEWPDGRPAAGCSIDLRGHWSDRVHGWRSIRTSFTASTSADGTFSVSVEKDGSYHLTARSADQNEPPSTSDPSRRSCGVAGVDGISPGKEPLVVVLTSGCEIHGRVVDDTGGPYESFFLHASMYVKADTLDCLDDVTSKFENSSGEFTLSCLLTGHWLLTPTADGRNGPTSGPRILPDDGSQVVLVVPRGATISGTVFDPSGAPASYAEVRTSRGSLHDTADGRFRLDAVEAGEFDLWAAANTWAPSSRIRITAEPGQSIDGLVLRLRVGGRITGEALDEKGRPDAGRKIKTSAPFGESIPEATSDLNGAFEIRGLPQGRYSIFREANTNEMSSMNDSGPSRWSRFSASRSHAIVDVVEGATAHVVLGGPKGGGIGVHGRVSAVGIGTAAVRVKAVGFTSSGEDLAEAETDSQGRFELKLDEPDLYDLMIALPDQSMGLSYWKWLGQQRDESLDLALPEGIIRGVARSVADQPLAGIWISLGPPAGASDVEGWSGAGSAVTDERGNFSFIHVPGGAYDLVYGSDESNESKTTRLTLQEGTKIENVVLRVP